MTGGLSSLREARPSYIQAETTISTTTTYLSQSDFDNGTVILSDSGTYILSEDIVFNPKEDNDFWPTDIADGQPFTLGFFSAISVQGSHITIDLNQHTIRQSLKHNTQQRFFACIELAGQPFIPGQGPANFGTPMTTCSNVTIKNGYLGLSSHHSIHGNNATKVVLENLTMYDFEIGAVSLNGCTGVVISNIDINHNYKNVKLKATYSQSRFLMRYVKTIINDNVGTTIDINGSSLTGEQIRDNLQTEMDETYNQVINDENISSTLFKNDSLLPDGCCYGIVVNTKGVVVNDFISTYNGDNGNKDIVLLNVNIQNITCNPHEVKAMTTSADGGLGYEDSSIIKDAIGGVIRFNDIVNQDTGVYVPNTLTNAQFFVAKYTPSAGKTNVPQVVLDWAAGTNADGLSELHVVNQGDSMAHHMKGTIGLFLSSATNVKIENTYIENIKSVGEHGIEELEHDYKYMGACTRGIAIVSSKNVYAKNVSVNGVSSKSTACGIFLLGEVSNVDMTLNKCCNIICDSDYCASTNNNPLPISENITKQQLTENNIKITIK